MHVPRYERHLARQVQWQDPPTIVYLPGLFAGGWIWESTWQAVARQTNFDQLRFVDSLLGLELKVTDVSVWRNWLRDFLNSLNIERPILVGNSLGGLIVVDFAAHFPERVVAGVASGAPGASQMPVVPLEQIHRGWFMRADARKLSHFIFHDPSKVTEELIDRTHKEVSGLKRMRACLQSLKVAKEYEIATLLPRIRCPLMMLWGDHDKVTPLADWLPYLDRIEQGQLKVIESCGHSPMVEKPDEFNAHLLDYLQRINLS
jgi:pimeloyl-ACP methyl ester carboxylesterase